MRKIGYLILAIITALACSLGTVGCKEKDMLDYLEDEVYYELYTTDETSEWYDAEQGYGLLPMEFEYTSLKYMASRQSAFTIREGQYTYFMFTPKTNAYKVKLKKIEFNVIVSADVELEFKIYGMIGFTPNYSNAHGYVTINCKKNDGMGTVIWGDSQYEIYNQDSEYNIENKVSWKCENKRGEPFMWTEKTAGKYAESDKERIVIELLNKGEIGDVRWRISNPNFVFE